MSLFFAIMMLVLNFAISWFNAWAVGGVWADSAAAGGMARAMAWAGAVMSACGFTWCYLVVLSVIASATGILSPHYSQVALELGYAIIIVPVLGSGMTIWAESVAHAWKKRTFGSVAGAAWNTYAQVHNTYQAARLLPEVFKDLENAFGKGGDRKGKALLLVVLLVILALASGVFTTMAIIRSHARAVAQHLARNAEQVKV